MKYVIVIPDGCADEPQASLGEQTPLAAAATPAMDEIASSGLVGRANHTPLHLPAGSDVANLSLLGYAPDENFTGRAPLEAAAQGIQLGSHDWAIRCNLVTIADQIMRNFTADHISSEEARTLLQHAAAQMKDPNFEFIPGVSYRNLLIYRGSKDRPAPFSMDTRTTPPHDLTDKTIEDDFPRGLGSPLLSSLMQQSGEWFADHPVNLERVKQGKLPATHVWLWGLGRQPNLDLFAKRFGVQGAMITAVDLLRGLAALVGWDRIEVPGATGYVDTDYAAKGRYAIEALKKYDIVCIHVEASDEASHEGDCEKKVAALESVDALIVRPVLDYLKGSGDFRMLVTPDHPTLIRTKTHTHGDVPFTICGTDIESDSATTYCETSANESSVSFPDGSQLMPFFMGKEPQ